MLFIPPSSDGKLAEMRRRRLMLVGLVALTALGLWVGWGNRLSEEERQVVGKWYRREPHGPAVSRGPLVRLDFFPDRTCSVYAIDERTGAALWSEPLQFRRHEWRVRDGKLIETENLGFVDRVRGMLPAGFPGAVAVATVTLVVERLTADELILRDRAGNILRLTRTPPD
jgi:hypothetical protein